MIRKLVVEGLTVFPHRVAFDFVPGVNIIVGGNDSGKSHLMKLCYAISRWGEKSLRREFPETWAEERRLVRCLLNTFGTRDLTALISRYAPVHETHVHASMQGEKAPLGSAELDFTFREEGEEGALSITTMPQRFLQENALYLPPREVLSLFPCYLQVGKRYPDLLDAAGHDLCQALEGEPTHPPEPMRRVLRLIALLLRGQMQRQGTRFVLRRGSGDMLDQNLVAEGFKRLGTISLLIANGSLRPGSTLYWDEPEMNINAAHLPLLCGIMLGLCEAGVQLILTTHSLFLLRELVIRLGEESRRELTRRFIGLQPPEEATGAARVSVGSSLDDISPLASLEAEMDQADRYLRMPNPPSLI